MNKKLIIALGYALLMLIFPVVSSVIIQIAEITNETSALLIQAGAFGIATLLGLFLMKRRKNKIHERTERDISKVLWFTPLIMIEIIPLFLGFRSDLTITYVITLVIFTVFVGLSEEIFFRGLVLNTLKENGVKYGIIVSSVMFGILHLSNIAGGVSIEYAILQVLFAFLFGLVAAQLAVITKSLIPIIIWHFSHDFIAFITGDAMILTTPALVILGIQCIILIVYCIYLWKRIPSLNNKM